MSRSPLPFCTELPTHGAILIIASGPSADQPWPDLLPDDLKVLAVNGAIRKLPRADYWFTLDPSESNKDMMAERREGTRYFCAVPDNFGEASARPSCLRGPILPHVSYLHRISGVDRGIPAAGSIYTGNSGHGALQLALQMGAKRIGIIGIDCTDSYWYGPGKPGKLANLPAAFWRIKDDVEARKAEVRIGSTYADPAIKAFPAMKPAEVIEWLR